MILWMINPTIQARTTRTHQNQKDASIPDGSLPEHFDILGDAQAVRASQLQRLAVHQRRELPYPLAHITSQRQVLLGENQAAVQLLLETKATNANFYTDALRACIISSVSNPTESANTIKLVAMNLIAAGRLMEGVELLVLIGNGIDACRYMQTYGKWDEAARLAKSILPKAQAQDILIRHAEHLSASGLSGAAALQWVTLGQHGGSLSYPFPF